MNLPDPARLDALAHRLALTPRQLLALAVRVARSDEGCDRAWLERELACVGIGADTAVVAAERVLLGYAGYALDDVDQGLLLAWSGAAGLDP